MGALTGNHMEVGPGSYLDSLQPDKLRLDRQGALVVQQSHGRYYEQANRGALFTAHAIVTAPVIYTTAAGTGGPLLWNGSTTHKAVILAVGWGISTVSTAAAIIGLTGNTGQTAAPSSTTAIDSVKNCYLGGAAPACTAYRIGTPSSAGNFFHPLGDVKTGALTTEPGAMNWSDLGGLFVVPPTGWISIAASATASTTVGNFGLIWEEVPIAGDPSFVACASLDFRPVHAGRFFVASTVRCPLQGAEQCRHMSTISVTEETVDGREGRVFVNTWEGFTTNGDVGEALEHVSCRDRCVTFTGSWGSGGTAVLQGSNDETTWFTLKDQQGNAISKTSDGLSQVADMPRFLRPKITAGTGSIDIDVILVERMGFR